MGSFPDDWVDAAGSEGVPGRVLARPGVGRLRRGAGKGSTRKDL